MKTPFLISVLILALLLGSAFGKEAPERTPKKFRLLRTERKRTSAVLVPDGPVVTSTFTYGVFAFRYDAPEPLEFWGQGKPMQGKFKTRFAMFRVRDRYGWRLIPDRSSGTDAFKYVLQPGVDYELSINLDRAWSESGETEFKASALASGGLFWSEPFTYRQP